MASKTKTMGLFEFLEEAELQQYYNSLKDVLQVQSVQQLKYVLEEDLCHIGMSKSDAKKLRAFFQKMCPQNYATKLKRLLNKTSSNRKDEMKQEFLLLGDEETNVNKNRRYSTMSNIKVPSQHIIPAEAIAIHKELGSGEFGVVQQGVWTDDDQMRHQVAIKCLSKERMQNNTFEFMKEYDIMQAIDHPNIVRPYGVVFDAAEIMLVTELAPLRSLLECLKEPPLRSTFTVPCLANFAVQICQGMKYLEAKRLIHRDLAARNILVFSKNVVKVSDFGLSRALGVGKDYYQTNFNVDLKLPIAWCAPECINFLKFTSASDVWAFGVTLWEMFSYGFQPWAAQTGQQILEAIDEPQYQRLERPVHCPKDHYTIMQQMWRHDPLQRPTFEKLLVLLEDAKPEQVQAVSSCFDDGFSQHHRDMLEFEVGDIITVLEKHKGNEKQETGFWSGCLNNGRVGYFSPSNTVTYVGMMPSSQGNSRWQNEEIYNLNSFSRNSLRGSKGSRRKISRDMISGPRGEVQHTGHIGADGVVFGNVGFQTSTNSDTLKFKTNGTVTTNKELPFVSMPSLTRADSDASERAPLITTRGSTSSGTSMQNGTTQEFSSPPGVNTANKNPRMGYAIGYLRKTSNASQQGINLADAQCDNQVVNQKPHEYQTISDEEFGGPLDLGPSLMDEVFNELESSKDSEGEEGKDDDDFGTKRDGFGEKREKRLHSMKDMKDLVSSTLTLTARKHRRKQQATVKPIKASDEKTLNNAIAMANALASKSMHDLDKRHLDDFYDHTPPANSPLSPNSPSKRFSFWFPGKASSPRGDSRHFIDEVNNPHNDVQSMISQGAKDAYKALIEGKDNNESNPASPTAANNEPTSLAGHQPSSLPFESRVRHKSVEHQRQQQPLPTETNFVRSSSISTTTNNNPLPLPPKSERLALSQPPKRHVRKNPLIISSGVSANLLRNQGVSESEHYNLQVADNSSMFKPPLAPPPASSKSTIKKHQIHTEPQARVPSKSWSHEPLDPADAFENEIACSMDALDNIATPPSSLTMTTSDSFPTFGSSTSVENTKKKKSLVAYNQDHVSCEDLLDFRPNIQRTRGKARGENSDEVRIMKKVLGQDLDPDIGVQALDITDWNVHHAIKLIKIKNLMKAPQLTDIDMKVALQTRDWDVAKAASVLMKKIKE